MVLACIVLGWFYGVVWIGPSWGFCIEDVGGAE